MHGAAANLRQPKFIRRMAGPFHCLGWACGGRFFQWGFNPYHIQRFTAYSFVMKIKHIKTALRAGDFSAVAGGFPINADQGPRTPLSPGGLSDHSERTQDGGVLALTLCPGQARGTRYEHLIHAAKAFIFTVIVKDGRADCTIYYPGVFQVTGYTEEEYAAQPQLWYEMVFTEDQPIVLRQIAQLLRGEAPAPIKHRIKQKDGLICWLRNTSVPVFDAQGKLIAYDGLIADISESEFTAAAQNDQIIELTTTLAMVKTLHSLLPICCSCKKIRNDAGYWEQLEAYIEGHYSMIKFTHGICPDCIQRLYPQFYEKVCARIPSN